MYQETIQATGASAVEVEITCDQCQTVFSTDAIAVPSANEMADSISDSTQYGDSEEYLCPECEKEYTVAVSNNLGGDIDIDIEELEVNATVSIRPIFRQSNFEDED